MAEKKAPLLLKDYYYNEDCAGCQVEKRKAENPNLPWLHFFFIWIITLCSSLPISSIFPFLYYMVRDFNIAKREEDVSFYAGFEGSAFMIGRTLTAVLWGMVADRYGRKPVMILSTLSVVIFNTMFGLSTNYWMALATRLLLGAFCGTLGPMRAYATEVSRREHQALGVAMMTSSWGIGLVIGPAIGGYLAQPADKFPSVFSQESIFGRFPYFLVSLVISIFAMFVFVLCFWLPETLHTCTLSAEGTVQNHSSDIEDADTEKLQNSKEGASNSWFSLLKNWPLMSTIIVYCVFQLHDMAYIEIFSLWTVSPKSVGGLSLSTEDVGQALAVAGIGLLFCQLLLYPFLERKLGPITVSRVGAVLSIALLSCYPFFENLRGTSLSLVVDLASAVKNVLSVSITTGLFLLQNRAVNQHQRGAANGLSLCIMSFCKALGPAAAGSLLSWAQTRQMANFLPGTHMVFFILNVVELLGFLMTYKPFLQKPAHEYC
ncbi:protein ZINC INDUCED FACILITATOR-LIKE 1-like isoform X2 [Chenopodium quinoa]|uniref:protein ZINC INDUCED FACILITATOR-LIKE 1-like isoform X2 n=1 Tax=Chenopodium quinoa TaxID=63459 RepID=UPI000B795AAB|nr:protein ZINC INDUCED FACILITATOR-LIKE 1-like isoform X2 [Chenopodium quinoa]